MGRLLASAPLALLLLLLPNLAFCQITAQLLPPAAPEADAAALARCDTSQEARDHIAKKAVRALWETGDFQVIEVRCGLGLFRLDLNESGWWLWVC